MTLTELVQEPGTLVMLGTLAVLGGLALILSLVTRDPCPSCGKQLHTKWVKKVTCAANLKSGGQWVTFDVQVIKCRTPECKEPEIERPLPPRPATEEEVVAHLLP